MVSGYASGTPIFSLKCCSALYLRWKISALRRPSGINYIKYKRVNPEQRGMNAQKKKENCRSTKSEATIWINMTRLPEQPKTPPNTFMTNIQLLIGFFGCINSMQGQGILQLKLSLLSIMYYFHWLIHRNKYTWLWTMEFPLRY